MSSIQEKIAQFKTELTPYKATLIAVSKTHPSSAVQQAFDAGQLDFGENRVQELVPKYEELSKEILWHQIGHLQSNKVKYIAPFVHLIHSVDSENLLSEINKQAAKNNKIQKVLLQAYIAQEESKFGLDFSEIETLLKHKQLGKFPNIELSGLMAMASNTDNYQQVEREFKGLYQFYETIKPNAGLGFDTLCMGMSGDYKIALACGSTMVRVGSAIFGSR